jgi:hypothetical protein
MTWMANTILQEHGSEKQRYLHHGLPKGDLPQLQLVSRDFFLNVFKKKPVFTVTPNFAGFHYPFLCNLNSYMRWLPVAKRILKTNIIEYTSHGCP